VVYTYTVKNVTLPAGLPDDVSQMRNVIPTDDLCSPLNLISGDTNNDHIMQVSETWTYTCSQNFPNPGVYTNTVKVCGDEVADNIPMNYCSPPDTWTVTVTPPPAQQVAVKGANAVSPQCTLATKKSLKVRARELTTIKVTAKNVPAKTAVKIKLPGGKTVTAHTNKKGIAMLRVRPPKSGRASITAAKCSDVEKLTVRPARKTVSQRVPQVTG
jgi:hypothetical protein